MKVNLERSVSELRDFEAQEIAKDEKRAVDAKVDVRQGMKDYLKDIPPSNRSLRDQDTLERPWGRSRHILAPVIGFYVTEPEPVHYLAFLKEGKEMDDHLTFSLVLTLPFRPSHKPHIRAKKGKELFGFEVKNPTWEKSQPGILQFELRATPVHGWGNVGMQQVAQYLNALINSFKQLEQIVSLDVDPATTVSLPELDSTLFHVLLSRDELRESEPDPIIIKLSSHLLCVAVKGRSNRFDWIMIRVRSVGSFTHREILSFGSQRTELQLVTELEAFKGTVTSCWVSGRGKKQTKCSLFVVGSLLDGVHQHASKVADAIGRVLGETDKTEAKSSPIQVVKRNYSLAVHLTDTTGNSVLGLETTELSNRKVVFLCDAGPRTSARATAHEAFSKVLGSITFNQLDGVEMFKKAAGA
jgi:hypothetical protein